jgi:hypothetical protein
MQRFNALTSQVFNAERSLRAAGSSPRAIGSAPEAEPEATFSPSGKLIQPETTSNAQCLRAAES